jgi:hypothetical protein
MPSATVVRTVSHPCSLIVPPEYQFN